jgi:hypothetical protein
MINGAHVMIQSKDADADREFLTEVFKLPSADAGGGFMIFGLPASEAAIHESEKNDAHQVYFMCADIDAFVAEMKKRKIAYTEPADRSWGKLTQITLPGGGHLEVYQPRYKRPKNPA